MNHKILASSLRILISYFTGKEKIITLCSRNLILCFIILTLSLLNITSTSALDYQGSINIGFTFNPTLSISINPSNLTISDLTPGTASDSNSINVSVSTNTAYGYNITANVGNNAYPTTGLVSSALTANSNSTSSTSRPISSTSASGTDAAFAGLPYGSSITNKDNLPNNTWGYSYSLDHGTTWRAYSGLPLYSDTNHSAVLFSTYSSAYSTSLDFKIAAKAESTQPAGEYTNIINFYATSVPEPPLLYDVVQDMSKGTLADNNVKLSDPITQANSGVYTYDPDVYGVASDASNDYPIYFYRGILDTDAGLGTYGSDGQADAWPNYVKLNNNTCWRIVRTTGSGGVKMIYNGTWAGTTCANATVATQVATQNFGLKGNSNNSDWYQNINRVGYTFNNNIDIQDITTSTPVNTVFGSNANYSAVNAENSNIKNYLENIWFANISSYESRLEPSAGYCNDRSAYSDAIANSILSEIAPYATSGEMYFGAYGRNVNAKSAGKTPSLSCPRGAVDLYTVSDSSTGNGQLAKPVALLTADETSLAGSGRATGSQGSSYSVNSYLRSGSGFWLFSPYDRDSNGMARGFYLLSNGFLSNYYIYNGRGVRPVISLMHHIQVTGGNGTATSPWTIE